MSKQQNHLTTAEILIELQQSYEMLQACAVAGSPQDAINCAFTRCLTLTIELTNRVAQLETAMSELRLEKRKN